MMLYMNMSKLVSNFIYACIKFCVYKYIVHLCTCIYMYVTSSRMIYMYMYSIHVYYQIEYMYF